MLLQSGGQAEGVEKELEKGAFQGLSEVCQGPQREVEEALVEGLD